MTKLLILLVFLVILTISAIPLHMFLNHYLTSKYIWINDNFSYSFLLSVWQIFMVIMQMGAGIIGIFYILEKSKS